MAVDRLGFVDIVEHIRMVQPLDRQSSSVCTHQSCNVCYRVIQLSSVSTILYCAPTASQARGK